ncbi:ParB/RepB/Spo0J family partition protein [Oharaeibacter diazotrophicus]|uniref:Chromosome segregation DNA-binding protein n=1 Tax=Oharaeibacter diazotrophicus TaxID=1920512 RepID=A0A4V3CVZ3_9HYPH|nr:ParB/RepB/Spo0J family partition protein [Oharaeibacter diazotrophicus]TDP84358.1 chromosome segregation DNA-binding protein [Oharaeibacter diazotrophicus]BBE73395.1 chromosome-partitioning protein ParB [Pleomorphomonas sp. SM30]
MSSVTDESGRRRLGRGLAALIGDAANEFEVVERVRGVRKVAIDMIAANPRNPRRIFREEELDELASSIRQRGVLQPIVVRPAPSGGPGYELVAGERRWRAAQKAGTHEIPVVIQELSDKEALEIAIIENVQRQDLNPLEEAYGYEQLISEFEYTQQDLAQVIGKSRSHVANTLRLLKLPEPVKQYLNDGALTAGHARALVVAPDPSTLARKIVEEGLTVRSAEALAQAVVAEPKGRAKTPKPEKDADTKALEKQLSDALGLAVEISHKPSGAGELKIRYASLDQLDEIVRRLAGH